jgi:hypothetical protein
VSARDSKYNRSEKGRARYARHREANREQRQAYDRERMARLRLDPGFYLDEYLARRRRELGQQRERILERLAELEAMTS